MRMMTASTTPPKNPAMAPRVEPIDHGHGDEQDGQGEREAGAVQDAAEHVPAELVRAEQVDVGGGGVERAELQVRGVRRQLGGEYGDH